MISNTSIKKLRWLMVAVMLFTMILAGIGQPAGYWHDPSITDERNSLFRWFMHLGWAPFLGFEACCLAGAFALVSLLPRCVGMVTLLCFVLGFYQGGVSWMQGRFHVDGAVLFLYNVAIATGLVLLGKHSPKPDEMPTPGSGCA